MELYDQYIISTNGYFYIEEPMSNQPRKNMSNKKKNINLVQYLCLAHNQEIIDQVIFLNIEYLWK
jgi:hypothetical protein